MLRLILLRPKGQAPTNKSRGLLKRFVEIDCQNSFFRRVIRGGSGSGEGVT